MIGVLPATTVVYILLGLGALLPVLLLAVVALTLCARRRTRKSAAASGVIPVDVALATGYHSNAAGGGFHADVGDDDVFSAKNWTEKRGWGAANRQAADFGGTDYRKRVAKMAGKVEVRSVQNPNVYFRNGRPPKLDALQYGVPPKLAPLEAGQLLRHSKVYRQHELSASRAPSCDVTMTSSSSSPSDADATSSSGNVPTSTGSTTNSRRSAALERDLSTTRSTLQREQERVLR